MEGSEAMGNLLGYRNGIGIHPPYIVRLFPSSDAVMNINAAIVKLAVRESQSLVFCVYIFPDLRARCPW